MNFDQFFKLNENVNKFDINWQIVRTKARAIKDVDHKIKYVLAFLEDNPTKDNYGRIHNWLRMTKLGYKSFPEQAHKFEDALDFIETNIGKYDRESEVDNDLSKVDTATLTKVYNDLKKRKYGFQIKTVPKSHTEFLAMLEAELSSRN